MADNLRDRVARAIGHEEWCMGATSLSGLTQFQLCDCGATVIANIALAKIGESVCSDNDTMITKLQEIADQYPADVFVGEHALALCAKYGISPDGISGKAIRERMLAEIQALRDEQ